MNTILKRLRENAGHWLSRMVSRNFYIHGIKAAWTAEEENEFWRREAIKTRHDHRYTPDHFKDALLRYIRDCREKGIEYPGIG